MIEGVARGGYYILSKFEDSIIEPKKSSDKFYCMKKSKIVHLNHVSYLGGAEIALLNLLNRCDRKRYEPVVLAPEGALTQALEGLGIRCEEIPPLPGLNRYTLSRFLVRLPGLWGKIKREQPDLLYANTNFASLYSGILGQVLGIPTLGHIRDIEPLGRMGRSLIRRNSALIAISQAVARYLTQEQVPSEQIHCVYDGVDLQQYQARKVDAPQHESRFSTAPPAPLLRGEGRNKEFLTDSSLRIGIVGQIGSRKGHLFLLEALRELVRSFPELMLWIVGVEPEHSTEAYTEKLLQTVEEWKLQNHVKFWDFRSDIPELLIQLDVLVLPSLQEPFGKIVIEAMAMGTAVVASNVGGVPEIIQDGESGLLVPPGDAAALRGTLTKLLSNKDLRFKIGTAGRLRVHEHFSLQRNVAETQALYEKLLVM